MMNGEHKLILDAVGDVRKDIRQINERLEYGALTFASKNFVWKVGGVLFALIAALAGITFKYLLPSS